MFRPQGSRLEAITLHNNKIRIASSCVQDLCLYLISLWLVGLLDVIFFFEWGQESLFAATKEMSSRAYWTLINKSGLLSWKFIILKILKTAFSICTGWRTKCHTIDCAQKTVLLLQKHLTSGTKLILIGWKIVRNEVRVRCDHRFASQPPANEPLHSSQLFDTSLQKARGTNSLCGLQAALYFLASSNVSHFFFCTITRVGPPQVSHLGSAFAKAGNGNGNIKIFVKE